jgi:hypothetical protein
MHKGGTCRDYIAGLGAGDIIAGPRAGGAGRGRRTPKRPQTLNPERWQRRGRHRRRGKNESGCINAKRQIYFRGKVSIVKEG